MIKRLLPWLTFILLSLSLILLFTQKDNLNNYLSEEMKTQNEIGAHQSIKTQIDSLYNYIANGQEYQITFLEFGATGCIACRKMEYVLDDVTMAYPGKVKVVFLNILQTQNQIMMKYYGVATIPTQVLLDKNGEEFFRHTGFYSFNDLKEEIDQHMIN